MRKASYVFFGVGVIFICCALWFLYGNIQEEENAGEIVEIVHTDVEEEITGTRTILAKAEAIPDYILNPNMEMPAVEVDGYAYIGTLSIPVLNLELPVMDEWSYPGLKIAPGRFAGSAYDNNPFVICGHNYKKHFGTLNTLLPGDSIVFTDMDGNQFCYEVQLVETLEPNEEERMLSDEWDLTLFTCTPGGRSRVTVRCVACDEAK